MFSKRLTLALAAFAATLPLVGCRHGNKCCSSPPPSASFAVPCNDCGKPTSSFSPGTLPAGSVPISSFSPGTMPAGH